MWPPCQDSLDWWSWHWDVAVGWHLGPPSPCTAGGKRGGILGPSPKPWHRKEMQIYWCCLGVSRSRTSTWCLGWPPDLNFVDHITIAMPSHFRSGCWKWGDDWTHSIRHMDESRQKPKRNHSHNHNLSSEGPTRYTQAAVSSLKKGRLLGLCSRKQHPPLGAAGVSRAIRRRRCHCTRVGVGNCLSSAGGTT